MSSGLIITIDGPSGSGKSTLARDLARRLGYLYLDTGAMYRALALAALRRGIALTDGRKLAALAQRSRIAFRMDPGHRLRVLLDRADVTEAIRVPAVSEAASRVATLPGVRKALVAQQKAIGSRGRVVAEGRDTGTVVFPKATLKVFLTATPAERARRRLKDLRAQNHTATLAEVLRDLKSRDRRDRQRADSPLRSPPGALRIDNSKLKSTQVVDRIFDYVQRSKRR